MERKAFGAEDEAVEYENALLHLRTFIHGLSRLVDQGATVPLEEVQVALEGDWLGQLLADLKGGIRSRVSPWRNRSGSWRALPMQGF